MKHGDNSTIIFVKNHMCPMKQHSRFLFWIFKCIRAFIVKCTIDSTLDCRLFIEKGNSALRWRASQQTAWVCEHWIQPFLHLYVFTECGAMCSSERCGVFRATTTAKALVSPVPCCSHYHFNISYSHLHVTKCFRQNANCSVECLRFVFLTAITIYNFPTPDGGSCIQCQLYSVAFVSCVCVSV